MDGLSQRGRQNWRWGGERVNGCDGKGGSIWKLWTWCIYLCFSISRLPSPIKKECWCMDPSLHKSPDLKIESFPDIPLLTPASKKAKWIKFKIKFVFCIQRPKNLFMFLLIFWRVKKCYMWYTNESRWDQRRCSRTPLENIIERLFHLDYSRYFRDFSLGRWL